MFSAASLFVCQYVCRHDNFRPTKLRTIKSEVIYFGTRQRLGVSVLPESVCPAQVRVKHCEKFGWLPLSDVAAVTKPRRESR